MTPTASALVVAVLVVAPVRRSALDLAGLARPAADGRVLAARYDADLGSLQRAYPNPASPTRHVRLARFHAGWLAALDRLPASADRDALRDRVRAAAADTDRRAARLTALAPLLPFAPAVVELEDARRRLEPVDPVRAAEVLTAVAEAAARARPAIDAGFERDAAVGGLPLTDHNLAAAADATEVLADALRRWHAFFAGYDPLFTWWAAQPYREAAAELDRYAAHLRTAADAVRSGERDQPGRARPPAPASPADVPDLAPVLAEPRSEFAPVVQRYTLDRRDRRPPEQWLAALAAVDYDRLSPAARVDYHLLANDARRQLARRSLDPAGRPPRSRDSSGIPGQPIGRAALLAELRGEMLPYTPEELIEIAEREYAWCQAEIRKAAREMGHGDDWRAAVEAVKREHVEPGRQPDLVRDLAREAVSYLRRHDLVTVPALCDETWRMEMMSADAQRFNPFFTGGEVVTVAFPTDAMSHAAKLQSLRGNNVHFSRATVQHELLPGHALQMFANARHQPHRSPLGTPLWMEGWAMYWELVLYARGDFAKTPEDRVGFLVWRMHRCCRVAFSFGFHLGKLTPQECVDMLVRRVGFEPANAAAEVRRSFGGAYGPVYQAAYLLGAMQFWALRQELVETGKMTERAFHDAILRENRVPVPLVREVLHGRPPPRDWRPDWRFAGELRAERVP
jgi:hypothetical protein